MVDICVAEDVPWEISSSPFYWWHNIPGSDHIINAKNVTAMVGGILALLGPRAGGSIKHIFIGGHGADGQQSIGLGASGADYTGNTQLRLGPNGTLLGVAGPMLAKLAPYLAPDCVVTLGGCQVAESEVGRKFLLAVSKTLGGVAVQASNVQQWTIKGQIQGTIWRAYHGEIYNLGQWSKIPEFQPGTSRWPPQSSGTKFNPVSKV
jgi:hypothetical protein